MDSFSLMAEHTRFEKLVAEAKKNIQEISPQETAAVLKRGDTLLIDVRDPDEWAEGSPERKISVAERWNSKSKKPRLTFRRRSSLIAAAAVAPPWPLRAYNEWATKT